MQVNGVRDKLYVGGGEIGDDAGVFEAIAVAADRHMVEKVDAAFQLRIAGCKGELICIEF